MLTFTETLLKYTSGSRLKMNIIFTDLQRPVPSVLIFKIQKSWSSIIFFLAFSGREETRKRNVPQ